MNNLPPDKCGDCKWCEVTMHTKITPRYTKEPKAFCIQYGVDLKYHHGYKAYKYQRCRISGGYEARDD